MPRPPCSRRIAGRPASPLFKPAGVPAHQLEEVVMTLDEFEALRLADLNGLYQAEAARQMAVSRATFSRIVESARRKTADVLVHGKALRVEGGPVRLVGRRCCPAHDADAVWRGVGRGRAASRGAPDPAPKDRVDALRQQAAHLEQALREIENRIDNLERTEKDTLTTNRGADS